MTALVIRKIPWEFDASVPFMWQPANPDFGLFCNVLTFIAVPFERDLVSVVRKAADMLDDDPVVAAGCRRRPTVIPPTNRCPTGPTPGCVNTTVAPT
jgi:hypothetical protein